MHNWLNPTNIWRYSITLVVLAGLVWMVVATLLLPRAGVDVVPGNDDVTNVLVFPRSITATTPEEVCVLGEVVFAHSFRGLQYEATMGPYGVKWTEGDAQVAFTFGADIADYPEASDTLLNCLERRAVEVLPE